ncbi:hypothetical protein HaLaN_12929 [Haematococcus lacustris]|uniref:Uncharacterized protein n=1 Tax=Haematococcus lacustris TaxID=44745 RepID=A0A699Z371_HAELA|nr:hypothetical protein HaLaN_12929 [Haematococcus lacustris]
MVLLGCVSGVPNMGLLQINARHLTISASHWSFCSRTATCAREQTTAAIWVSLARAPRRGDWNICSYSLPPNTPSGSAQTKVWGGGGLSATSLQPLFDPTAAADAHAHVEQPKRRGRSQR